MIVLRARAGPSNIALLDDGVARTDGLGVVSATLPAYPNGLLVVRDDTNLADAVPGAVRAFIITAGQSLPGMPGLKLWIESALIVLCRCSNESA